MIIVLLAVKSGKESVQDSFQEILGGLQFGVVPNIKLLTVERERVRESERALFGLEDGEMKIPSELPLESISMA